MPTIKTEINFLKWEVSHARKEDTALEKINHELSTIDQLQHQRIDKLEKQGATLPKEFTKHRELTLIGSHETRAKPKHEKSESTTEDRKSDEHNAKSGGQIHLGRVADPNACEAQPEKALPKKDSNGSGFSRLTICDANGSPEKQIYFDLDGKTKTGFKQWFSDGHTEAVQLSSDTQRPESKDIEYSDRSGVFLRYGVDGKSIIEKDTISSKGLQKFEQFDAHGKKVSEFGD